MHDRFSDAVSIVTADVARLGEIVSLWYETRDFHARASRHFSAELARKSWPDRLAELQAGNAEIGVILAETDETKTLAGYCVCSIESNGRGELDSLFVLEPYRGRGLGRKLTATAMDWLKARNAARIRLYVTVGNEAVLKFYEAFGFRPRNLQLEWKPMDGNTPQV